MAYSQLVDLGHLVGSDREFQLPNLEGLVGALEDLWSQPNRFWDVYNSGMPQGFPTSPFMSMLSLRSFLTQQTSISYADDPVFFGDSEFEIKACGPANQEISKEKSNWIKKDGVWLTPLKFLGIEYDGKANTLSAKTRNGATLSVCGDEKSMLEAVVE